MKRLPRSLLLSIVLLVLAVVAFAVVHWRGAVGRERLRQQLLDDIATETGKMEPDGNELSQLRVRVQREADAATDRRLLLALVQIERVRHHYRDAWELLKAVATAGDARVAEQHEGAVVLLGLHQYNGERERARAAQSLAETAFASSHAPADLLLAWTAAQRLGNAADRDRLAQELREQHGSSKEGRLLQALLDLDHMAISALDLLLEEFTPPPVELQLARAQKLLEANQVVDAIRLLDRLATEAPGVVDVRHVAAIAHWQYLQATGSPASERQASWTLLQNHLHWCLDNARVDDQRRETWQRLLDSH